MIDFVLNGRQLDISTVELLGQALDVADSEKSFKLSVAVPGGPTMVMLRNEANAWLMYFREQEDAGFRSSDDTGRQGDASFTLGNGQVDTYPLSYCIDVEQCYKAVAYFCVNEGAKPKWVSWVNC
jgi:hypothetical protein